MCRRVGAFCVAYSKTIHGRSSENAYLLQATPMDEESSYCHGRPTGVADLEAQQAVSTAVEDFFASRITTLTA
jgi:hypothetical protein